MSIITESFGFFPFLNLSFPPFPFNEMNSTHERIKDHFCFTKVKSFKYQAVVDGKGNGGGGGGGAGEHKTSIMKRFLYFSTKNNRF